MPNFVAGGLLELRLAANAFFGIDAGFPGLAAHPSLRVLDLTDNRLAALPPAWQRGAEGLGPITAPLEVLRLSGNPGLAGKGFPRGLATYPNLTSLALADNGLG